ncbi:MAG: DUF302 domain-containing protein [Sulfurimonas sp.]|nr:DUF302 domain-containing protein [Sulfurimonas sp.]
MKTIITLLTTLFMAVGLTVCSVHANEQNLQIFSAPNEDAALSAKTIEKAFNKTGLFVDVNNDMNSIFSKRYGNVYHDKYNLAIFTNTKLVKKLMKKHPSIGLITPLSMSIYSAKDKSINISTLSLAGMSRITGIDQADADLIAYAKLVDLALHNALAKGKYLSVKHATNNENLVTSFTTEFELEDGDTYADAKDSFKEEFESEISPVGFLVPKSYMIEHEDYDFFDTYSIIRFNAIFPVSKNHPDAGAYAPFSLAIYKKKNDDTVHISFPSIKNWIKDLDIKDKETADAVTQTHIMIQEILEELTE